MRLDFDQLTAIKEALGDFQIGSSNDNIYLKFDYWRRIDIKILRDILPEYMLIQEFGDWDEDCGYKFHYDIIHKAYCNG